ncbi:MAG: hypothetical protein SNJ76_04625 [Fimbriimonadaceae bacterium]
MSLLRELLSTAGFALAGLIVGQVFARTRDGGAGPARALAAVAAVAAGFGLALFVDPNLSVLDQVLWPLVFAAAFVHGWKSKSP